VRGSDGQWYRWRDSCQGDHQVRGFLALADAESDHDSWHKANGGWIRRARQGVGVEGGPKNTATAWFYDSTFRPYGRSWGAPFPPQQTCDEAPSPEPSISAPPSASVPPTEGPPPTEPPVTTEPPAPTATPAPTPKPTPKPTKKPTPKPPPPTEPPTEPPPTPVPPPTEPPATDAPAGTGG
jgi:hypothetical protein